MGKRVSRNNNSETKAGFKPEEEALLLFLSGVFKEDCGAYAKSVSERYSDICWEDLFFIAERHSVLALLHYLSDVPGLLPGDKRGRLAKVSREVLMQNYHLLFLGRSLVGLLEENGIGCVLLKGSATSGLYPVPELRKSGDVDLLLLNRDDEKNCCMLLDAAGFSRPVNQTANHHTSFYTKDNIEVEVHTMLAEPFDNAKTNRFFDELHISCAEHVCRKEIMGVELPVLDEAYHGFYLLLHMLQHFLRSGFGLKLLCDWVAFWRRDMKADDCAVFLQLVKDCGLYGFARAVTAACIAYLGLDAKRAVLLFGSSITEKEAVRLGCSIMREIIDAEEFGKSSNERMVMMRGSGLAAMVREFHHQMRLNFPEAGKIIVFWPVLWVVTLFRFLKNNRRLRGVSSGAVLRKARERSSLMKELELFK